MPRKSAATALRRAVMMARGTAQQGDDIESTIYLTETECGAWMVEDGTGLCDPITCATEQWARDEAESMADDVEAETSTRPRIEKR